MNGFKIKNDAEIIQIDIVQNFNLLFVVTNNPTNAKINNFKTKNFERNDKLKIKFKIKNNINIIFLK